MTQGTQDILQWINVLLTGGVLVTLIGAGIAYGRLSQKVETNSDDIKNLWKSHSKLEERVYIDRH